MESDNDTVRYTADDLEAKRKRGEGRLDRDRLAQLSDADIEAQAEGEPEFDWANADIGIPPKKTQLTMRLDQDIVSWFQAQGAGYQTRINAVLRQYMQAHKHTD
jgi:uncharacterized protein (DUF4415 family)